MAVIEAMVAAPIVALGVTHPEGEGAFGKGEQAIMILMNVFLRPAMMIIGYIAAIAMTYVSIWVINAGFDEAIAIIQNTDGRLGIGELFEQFNNLSSSDNVDGKDVGGWMSNDNVKMQNPLVGYISWAGTFGYFFGVIIYTMMYLIAVQKSFTLIGSLPDKVLRWIGGSAENAGQEAAGWGEEIKGKVDSAGKSVSGAAVQTQKVAMSKAAEAKGKLTGGEGGGNSSGSAS